MTTPGSATELQESGQFFKTEADFDGSAQRIVGLVRTLMADLEVLGTGWKGAGGMTFQQVKPRIEEELRKLTTALLAVGEAVGSSGRTYEATDQEVEQVMTSANSGTTGITAGLMGT